MTVTATAVVLGLLVAVALKAHWVRPGGALVCVVFGLVLGASAAGPEVNAILADVGSSVWATLRGL